MCILVSVCVHVCLIYQSMYADTCGGQRATADVIFRYTVHLLWISHWPGDHQLYSIGYSLSLGILLSLSPQPWVTGAHCHSHRSDMGLSEWTLVLQLRTQVLCWLQYHAASWVLFLSCCFHEQNNVHWSWFPVHWSWFPVYQSWFPLHQSWFPVCWSWFTVHQSWFRLLVLIPCPPVLIRCPPVLIPCPLVLIPCLRVLNPMPINPDFLSTGSNFLSTGPYYLCSTAKLSMWYWAFLDEILNSLSAKQKTPELILLSQFMGQGILQHYPHRAFLEVCTQDRTALRLNYLNTKYDIWEHVVFF